MARGMTKGAVLNVSRDFSRYPSGRYAADGPGSGEAMRNLMAAYLQTNDQLTVDLTGVMGCPSSFMEEAFGGLARNAGAYGLDPTKLFDRIKVTSNIAPNAAEARRYLQNALKGLADATRDDDTTR